MGLLVFLHIIIRLVLNKTGVDRVRVDNLTILCERRIKRGHLIIIYTIRVKTRLGIIQLTRWRLNILEYRMARSIYRSSMYRSLIRIVKIAHF